MVERPVECSHCKKPVKVLYKEIVGDSVIITEMCAECPVLQHKLQGSVDEKKESEAGLCCGHCGTSLESVKMGNPLGCSECYNLFSDLILSELLSADRIPSRLKQTVLTKKTQPIHIGKAPGKQVVFNPSSQLISLNEALNEALKRENYEQAAWLRDQIKSLTEKRDDGKS
jgi:protein arginine kinase activator